MDAELKKQVEAVMFSCGRKMEPEEMSQLVGAAPSVVRKALQELVQEYNSRDTSLALVEEGTAFKMSVREKYLTVVRKISPYMEFSKSVMETLAVVAWKQPILQSDVIRIRTNKAYDHIAELEELGFLAKEKHGRSFLLKLSQKFYDYFDLRSDVDVRNLFKSIKDDLPEVQTKITAVDASAESPGAEEQKPEKELEIEDEIADIPAKQSKDSEKRA